MKTWLANNKVISPNVPCLSLFTVLFDYVVVFFGCFVIRDLCRSGCRQNFANFYLTPPPPPLSLSLPLWLLFTPLPTILCHKRQLFEVSARVKLVRCRWTAYISLLLTLRNVSQRASCKALRWDKVNSIRWVCIVQYRIVHVFSFHFVKRIKHPHLGWDLRQVRYNSLF